jgi:hypothetical protein
MWVGLLGMGGLARAAYPLQVAAVETGVVESGAVVWIAGDKTIGSLDGCTLWETGFICQRTEESPVVSGSVEALAIAPLAEVTDRNTKPKAIVYISFFMTTFF